MDYSKETTSEPEIKTNQPESPKPNPQKSLNNRRDLLKKVGLGLLAAAIGARILQIKKQGVFKTYDHKRRVLSCSRAAKFVMGKALMGPLEILEARVDPLDHSEVFRDLPRVVRLAAAL